MPYGWVIDIDHIADKDQPEGSNCNAKGVMGPRNIPADIEKRLQSGEGKRFKMYDDDGELYYSGRCLIVGDDDSEEEFGPLDDFGRPNAGAVHIEYLGDDGLWYPL